MRNIGIYQISIGDYFYIGQSQDLKTRKIHHLRYLKKGTHPNRKMQNVYNKYQDFHFQETIFCSVEELNAQEQKLLDMFWGTDGCMNLAKCVEASTRGLKLSEETREKMREARKGKKHTEETKKKIAEALKGKKRSEETKKKMSQAHKGLYIGEKHPRYDNTQHTFLHDEHGEVTCTRYELRMKYNLNRGNLSRLISGERKSTKGWRLKK